MPERALLKFYRYFLSAILGFHLDRQIDAAVPDSQRQLGFSFTALKMCNADQRFDDFIRHLTAGRGKRLFCGIRQSPLHCRHLIL